MKTIRIHSGVVRVQNVPAAETDEITSKQFSSPANEAELKPNVDLRNVKAEDLVTFEQWGAVLAELEKINPAIVGSLSESQAKTVGNILLIIAKNRFFITLFKVKENAAALNEAILRATGSRYVVKAKCIVSKEEQQSMAENLIKKAQSSSIDTAVE